jgi:hypothetical protein
MGWTLTKDLTSNMVSRLNQDMGEPWTSTFKGGDGGRELQVPPVDHQQQFSPKTPWFQDVMVLEMDEHPFISY